MGGFWLCPSHVLSQATPESAIMLPAWDVCLICPMVPSMVMVVVMFMTPCLTVVSCFVGDRAFNEGAGEVLFKLKRCSWGE